MKVKKYDGTILRKILVGMVTNDVVVSRISTRWSHIGLFDVNWANIIGTWCVDYSRKHNKAPGANLRDLFENWANHTASDEATISSMETFLVSLSDDAVEEETNHILDLASNYFNKVRLKTEIEQASIELDRGFLEDAQNRLAGLNKVELGVGSFVSPGIDYTVWQQAFNQEERTSLVRYPGAVGEFFEGSFLRSEFYSFMGPDKTGKTTFLLDFAFRALKNRNRVVFFDTGDSTQDDIMVRLACRVTGCPEYEMECQWPVGWNEDKIEIETRTLPQVSPTEGFKKLVRSSRFPGAFRLSPHPNGTLTVKGIDSILSDWERDGWRPDVVVIDYADILAAPHGVNDPLEQIDENWKQMRSLSMSRHCLVVTATQSNAAAYGNEKALLTRKNFSGRKTKLAHVNGMIGINVSDDERQQHTARLNWVVRRKMRNRDRKNHVEVVGCFDVENPILQSRW